MAVAKQLLCREVSGHGYRVAGGAVTPPLTVGSPVCFSDFFQKKVEAGKTRIELCQENVSNLCLLPCLHWNVSAKHLTH